MMQCAVDTTHGRSILWLEKQNVEAPIISISIISASSHHHLIIIIIIISIISQRPVELCAAIDDDPHDRLH